MGYATERKTRNDHCCQSGVLVLGPKNDILLETNISKNGPNNDLEVNFQLTPDFYNLSSNYSKFHVPIHKTNLETATGNNYINNSNGNMYIFFWSALSKSISPFELVFQIPFLLQIFLDIISLTMIMDTISYCSMISTGNSPKTDGAKTAFFCHLFTNMSL